MNKKYLAYFIIGCFAFITITAYKTGPGTHGWDCTGAETGLSNPSGCTNCHGTSASSSLTLNLELDSAGIPVNHYVGGMSYIVKLSGVNTSSTSLPKFGFQIGCILGASAVTTPSGIGSWTSLPTSTHVAAPQSGNFVLPMFEQTNPISATTGSGGSGTTYVVSVSWTAPVAGTGTCSFWSVLNTVNNNNNESGDHWNIDHIVVNEEAGSITNNSIIKNADHFIIDFSNPVSGNLLYLKMNIPKDENLSADLYNTSGQFVKHIYNENLPSGCTQTTIQLGNEISTGLYFLHFQTETEVINKKVMLL